MVSRQDQTFVKLNRFHSGEPLFVIYLLISLVLMGAQAVGLGHHLSHLIYIYKSKITTYMHMVQFPIHRKRKSCYTSSLLRVAYRGLKGEGFINGE
jgi:hypothetical protein